MQEESEEANQYMAEIQDSAEGYSMNSSSGSPGTEGNAESPTGSVSRRIVDAGEVLSPYTDAAPFSDRKGWPTVQSKPMPWRERMKDSDWRVSQRMRHRLASREADTADFSDYQLRRRGGEESIDPYRGKIYTPDNLGSSEEDEGAYTARSGGSRGSSLKRIGKGKYTKKTKKKTRDGTSAVGTGSETDRSHVSRSSGGKSRAAGVLRAVGSGSQTVDE